MDIYNTLFPNDGSADSMIGNESHDNKDAENVENQRKLDTIITAFDQYCIPRKNITMETFKFNAVVQKENQPFADFETELRKQIQYCEFKCQCGVSYEDRMLRDRVIIGVHDKKLQLKLLDGKDESLKNVIEACKLFEAAYANKSLLDRNTGVLNINNVTEQQVVGLVNAGAGGRRCYNCGLPFTATHLRECRANGVVCHLCGRKGHFRKFCRQTKTENKWNNKKENNNEKSIKSVTNQGNLDWSRDLNSADKLVDGTNNFLRLNTSFC